MTTRERSTDLLTLLMPLVLAALSGSMACGNAGAPDPITGVVGQLRSIDYANLPNDSTIKVQSPADVINARAGIIQALWPGRSTLPTTLAENLGAIPASEMSPDLMNALPNLGSSAKLRMQITSDVTTNAYLFQPAWSINRAVIVHNGHLECDFWPFQGDFTPDVAIGLEDTLKALLAEGYTVVMMFMPGNQPGGPCNGGHQALFDLLPGSQPLKFFMEPVDRVINYLATLSPAFQDYSMTGHSGGGWTTTLYAAIDPRIKLSVPVAGSMPLYLSPKSGDAGDFEQVLPEFYSQWGYLDLYVMGAYGSSPTDRRRQVQILNRHDNCCFTGNFGGWQDPQWQQHLRSYETLVQQVLVQSSLRAQDFYRLEIDDAAKVHQISRNALVDQILLELNNGRRRIGAASRSHAFIRGLGGHIWHHGPSGWEDTLLEGVGVPSVVEDPSLHGLDVFYRDPGNVPMHAYQSQGQWVKEALSGGIISDPAAISTSSGTWDVAAVGADYGLYHWRWHTGGSVTRDLVKAGPFAVGTPAVATLGQGDLDVAVRVLDRSAWHFQLPAGGAWSAGEQVFGIITNTPTAADRTDYPSRRVYVRGPNHLLYEAVSSASGPWQVSNISRQVGQEGLFLAGSPSASVSGGMDVRVDIQTEAAGALATYELPTWSWVFGNDGGQTFASPTSVPGGEWARGTDGSLYLFDGAWHGYGGVME